MSSWCHTKLLKYPAPDLEVILKQAVVETTYSYLS